jgi:hypothetical protein
MQGFFSSPGSGSVQALSLMFVAAALSMGNLLLDMSIETARGQLIPIAGGGDVFSSTVAYQRRCCYVDRQQADKDAIG